MAEARVRRSIPGLAAPAPPRTPPVTGRSSALAVLDLVEALLDERGWCQGRPVDRSGRLSLDGAVEEAASRIATSEPRRMVLADRTKNQLCRCAGVGTLAAWNDEPSRQISHISELISLARFRNI